MAQGHCPYCYRPVSSLNRHLSNCKENPCKKSTTTRTTWDCNDQQFLQSELVFTSTTGSAHNSKRKKPFLLPSINNGPHGDADFGDLSTLSSGGNHFGNTSTWNKAINYKEQFEFIHDNMRNQNIMESTVEDVILQNDDFLIHDNDASTGMLNPCTPSAGESVSEVNVLQGNVFVDDSDYQYQIAARKSVLSYTRIFDVLNRCKVPHYGYDAIINTIASEVLSGRFDPCDTEFSRKSYLAYIQKRFPIPGPIPVQIRLENHWNLNGR